MEPGAFGEWVRAVRLSRSESLAQVARRAGMSASGVRKIELGEAYPTLDTANRICQALDITWRDAMRKIYG